MPRNYRPWNQYPRKFYDILEHFRESMAPRRIPVGAKRDALVLKTQYWRYFKAVRDAFEETPPLERSAAGLDLANWCAVNVVCGVVKLAPGDYAIELRPSPIADPFNVKPVEQEVADRLASQAQAQQRRTIMTREEDRSGVESFIPPSPVTAAKPQAELTEEQRKLLDQGLGEFYK